MQQYGMATHQQLIKVTFEWLLQAICQDLLLSLKRFNIFFIDWFWLYLVKISKVKKVLYGLRLVCNCKKCFGTLAPTVFGMKKGYSPNLLKLLFFNKYKIF